MRCLMIITRLNEILVMNLLGPLIFKIFDSFREDKARLLGCG